MPTILKLGTASVLALAMALPATAQTYRQTQESQRQQEVYQNQKQQYENKRDQYENSRDKYQDAREEYREARADYDRRLADWERARATYDARFGSGAYARYYARPDWNEGYWAGRNATGPGPQADSRSEYNAARRSSREARREYNRRLNEWERARTIYDARYGSGSYARMYTRPTWDERYWSTYSPPPYAGYYGSDTNSATVRCNDNSSTVAGGLIGALAGAVLGSNVASRGNRTEGAVLGGVAGAVIGGAVGNANDKYKCDSAGPYFTYDETMPYREGRNRFASSYDQGYYTRQKCRLAQAPVDSYGRDVRYVRVCPDDKGRFRITG